MLSRVCEATCPRLSPVTSAPAPSRRSQLARPRWNMRRRYRMTRREGGAGAAISRAGTSPNGHHVDARDAARALEHVRDVVHQVLRGRRRSGGVPEKCTPTHTAPRRARRQMRHRRVDAGGQKAHDRAGTTPPAGRRSRGLTARVHVGGVLHHFDAHHKVRAFHAGLRLLGEPPRTALRADDRGSCPSSPTANVGVVAARGRL